MKREVTRASDSEPLPIKAEKKHNPSRYPRIGPKIGAVFFGTQSKATHA